jgi:hypothetical protein
MTSSQFILGGHALLVLSVFLGCWTGMGPGAALVMLAGFGALVSGYELNIPIAAGAGLVTVIGSFMVCWMIREGSRQRGRSR